MRFHLHTVPSPTQSTSQMVQEFLESRVDRGRRPATVTWYRSLLERYAAEFPSFPPAPYEVERFLGRVPPTATRRHHYWQAIRALHRWARRVHEISDPTERLEPPARPRETTPYLSEAQVRSMFGHTRDRRERALLWVLFGAGLRVGEVAGLRHEDVGRYKMLVSGKTGHREVPTPPGLLELIEGLGAGGYVFVGERASRAGPAGLPLTEQGIRKCYGRVADRAGLTGKLRRPHGARHTFGRLYWLQTGDPVRTQLALGHQSPSMTARYIHPQVDDLLPSWAADSPLGRVGVSQQLSLFQEGRDGGR